MSEVKACVVVVVETNGEQIKASLFGERLGPVVTVPDNGIRGGRDEINKQAAIALIRKVPILCNHCWQLTAIDRSGNAFIFTDEG